MEYTENEHAEKINENNFEYENFGIHGELLNKAPNPEELLARGYEEYTASSNLFEQINSLLLQHTPGLAMHGLNCVGAYNVYFDKGLGVLQKARQGSDFVRANIVQPGNNKITGQALLKDISMAPFIANIAFSVLANITGQHYLKAINNSLTKIEASVERIIQCLDVEKHSDLLSSIDYIDMVKESISIILEDNCQKQATIIQIQQIRRKSYSDFHYYLILLKDCRIDFKKKDDVETVHENIDKYNVLCQTALNVYCVTFILEVFLCDNKGYWAIAKKHIEKAINEYKNSNYCLLNYMSDKWEQTKQEHAYKERNTVSVSGGIVSAATTMINPVFALLFVPVGLIEHKCSTALYNQYQNNFKDTQGKINKKIQEGKEYIKIIEKSMNQYVNIWENKAEMIVMQNAIYMKSTS